MKLLTPANMLAGVAKDTPDAEVVIQDTGKFLPVNVGFSDDIALGRSAPLDNPPEDAIVVHGLYTEALDLQP